MFPTLISALRETLVMTLAASAFAILIGIPLGLLIAMLATAQNKILQSIYYALFTILELANTTPYLLIMLLFIPLSNLLISYNISYTAATIIPLATAGSLILAHKINKLFISLAAKWAANTKSMGATKLQVIRYILIPESLPEVVNTITHTCGAIVGFSTIAGALGAGGLGQLAIEKSIHNPAPLYVVACIAMLVALQQLIIYTGALVLQQTQPR